MCSKCRTEKSDGWTGKEGGELCQMCWERECSESWWDAMNGLAAWLELESKSEEHPK
jgi:hypothetical protein